MRPEKIPEYLKFIYTMNERFPERRASVILLGPPGVGKTVSVKRAARMIADAYGLKFVDLSVPGARPESGAFHFIAWSVLHSDPVDFMGVPRGAGDVVEYALPEVLGVFTKPDARGVIFLDEVTLDPREDRRAALLKLVDEGMLGYRAVGAGTLIVMAGNTREWSSLAQELDEPMRRGRARIVFIEPPTVEEWIRFMQETYGDSWDKRIAGYLMMRPSHLFTKKNEEEDDGYTPLASPRNWTALALSLPNCGEMMEDEVKALLPGPVAAELLTYLTIFVPPVEELLSKPQTFTSLPREAKYLLLAQIVDKERDNYDRFIELYQAMDDESFTLLHVLRTVEARKAFVEAMRTRHPQLFRRLLNIKWKKDAIAPEDEV